MRIKVPAPAFTSEPPVAASAMRALMVRSAAALLMLEPTVKVRAAALRSKVPLPVMLAPSGSPVASKVTLPERVAVEDEPRPSVAEAPAAPPKVTPGRVWFAPNSKVPPLMVVEPL